MRATGTAMLLYIALLLLLSASIGSAASAQTPREAKPDLATTLTPGMTVWITDSGGREDKTRIVDVSGDVVITTAEGGTRRIRSTDVIRVRTRRSDSVLNGALIGAGAAIATGLFLCRLTEPWENCRDDVGPMFRIAAVGAGIGIGIDALIRGRQTIYEAAPSSRQLYAVPIVARRAAGLQLSVSF
jgi:hypothetical protein